MGFNVSPGFGKSAAKIMMAAFLASAATGCSSDVTRFGGLFGSAGQDRMATNSIQRSSSSSDMTPTADLDGAGGSRPVYAASQNAGQSYPGGAYGSSARMASAPVSVQRTELSAPGASSAPALSPPRPAREKQVALAQPFPAGEARKAAAPVLAPPKQAGKTASAAPQAESGWSATNAPSVTLRPGETIATLARRYGVPEKEILRINGMRSASSAQPGQAILIPTYNGGNAAKASANAADLAKGDGQDAPKTPEQKVAVMPGAGASRDKASQGDLAAGKIPAGSGKDPKPAGDSYTVKSGDSLAKIAKATGADIDAIKQANNLSGASLRIGQELVIPHGASADAVKTASVPAKTEAKVVQASVKPAEAAAQSADLKAPVATESVDDAAKKDMASVSPEGTGIGKYRWPVRGAVIAGYGANVNGSRNDGIDISVPQGTPIKAAENGVVIYAGNGLKQLGNTVLVRHDDGTVTVYGNADTLNVTRGQKIQRGQTVAVSGMSGDVKQPQVHFEVRKNATPVNPMTFLE